MKVLTEAELNVVAGGRRKGQRTKPWPDTSGNVEQRRDDLPSVL